MTEPMGQTHQWELEPHYGITHYSSDVWCPYCNYALHFADEIAVGQVFKCRGCGRTFEIGEQMDEQPKGADGCWIISDDEPMRGSIESREVFAERNLVWWKECRHLERRRRMPHYQKFLEFGNIWSILDATKTLAEVGPGPFGGMIEQCKLPTKQKYFIDYLLRELVGLRFITWPSDNTIYVHSPAERIPLPDNEVDFLISCNTLDHGWDVRQAIRECIRVSHKCALSFDCRGDSAEQRRLFADDKDHFQLLRYDDIQKFLDDEFGDHMAIATFDTEQKDYPVMYIKVNKDA